MDLEFGAGVGPELGVVGLCVVGEHPFDADPVFVIPAVGAAQEGGAVLLAFGGEELAVGEARVVVDRDVQMLPTGAAGALYLFLLHILPFRRRG